MFGCLISNSLMLCGIFVFWEGVSAVSVVCMRGRMCISIGHGIFLINVAVWWLGCLVSNSLILCGIFVVCGLCGLGCLYERGMCISIGHRIF